MSQWTFAKVWRAVSLAFMGLIVLMLPQACSLKQNNATTRAYHALTTRYNVYYNGSRQFDEAYLRFFEGQSESYTERIAFDPIAYVLAAQIGGEATPLGFFDQPLKKADKAIKEHSLRAKPERKAGWHKDPKQRAQQAKTEYNRVLYKAWMLRGASQLYNGQLQEALSTFDYITRLYNTEDEVRVPALLWQIRCLSLAKRPAEAKELFLQIDSARYARLPIYMGARAEYHLAMGQTTEAIPWLRGYAPHAKPRVQRMRLYYLLGQLYQSEGKGLEAYGAYRRVLGYSPPPALEFAARLRCAELSPRGSGAVRATLEAMSAKARYREHLDQIYNALGRNYLASGDTARALRAFVLASDSSQTKGQDYALSQMAQGDIYMARRRYPLAADKYQAALSVLSKDDRRYRSLQTLSEGLERLRPAATAAHEGDSLLRLARSPEAERLRVIDSVIHALRKREAEEARERQRDSIAQAARELAARLPGAMVGEANASTAAPTASLPSEDRRFYFYNPNLLRLGAQAFERAWGKRPLADLWRFRQKPDLGTLGADDSPSSDTEPAADAVPAAGESAAEVGVQEVYTRAYYLSQLPLTPEAQTTAEAAVEEAMLQMGQILTSDLERLPDAAAVYELLLERNPAEKHSQEALYALYILALRTEELAHAEDYRRRYLARYPSDERAIVMARGDYLERLRSRDRQIVETYHSAYEAYWRGAGDEVARALERLEGLAPESEYAARARFLGAMSLAMRGDRAGFQKELERLAATPSVPEDISSLSREILAGVQAGKPIFAGQPKPIDWGSLEGDRSQSGSAGAAYTPLDRGSRLAYLLLGSPALGINELVYQLSLYHYSEHTQGSLSVRPLSIGTDVHTLLVGSFASSGEAARYAEGWARHSSTVPALGEVLLIPIAERNAAQITSADQLFGYLRQMNTLELGALYGRDLQQRAERLIGAGQPRKAQPSIDTASAEASSLPPRAIGFDIEVKATEVDSVEAGSLVGRDHAADTAVLELPQERLLTTPTLSYEEVQVRQRLAEREQRAEQKERERQRRAELKLREQMQRQAQREREQERRRREREREKERKDRERVREKERREREQARDEAHRAREAARRAASRAKQ